MIVIFPADKLLLMTYGPESIPRISPRPTLDCLGEPRVPITYPNQNKNSTENNAQVYTQSAVNHIAYEPEYQDFEAEENELDSINSLPLSSQYQLQSAPPTILSTTCIQQQNWPPYSNNTFQKPNSPNQLLYSPQKLTSYSSPPPIDYDFLLIEESQPEYSLKESNLNYKHQIMDRTPSVNPNIIIDADTPAQITDPTLPIYGTGWGRPMSPMDLPSELQHSASSSSNRTTLLPRLHIPRLGRSSSSDHKDSNRLKEDLHLHVENPVFNSENLRQRNFDAFFESGEPKYKLHPTTPSSSTALDGSYSPSTLEKCSQVYTSSPKGQSANKGGLFAKSTNEQKLSSPNEIHVESVTADRGGKPQKSGRFLGKIFKWSTKS